MMNYNQRRKLAACLLAFSLCGIGVAAWSQNSLRVHFAGRGAPANVPQTATPESLIAGYRDWLRVNPQPVYMHYNVATLCMAPQSINALNSRAPSKENPHLRKYLTVYVNETGRAAMLEAAQPQFPIGSVIVKEKLSQRTGGVPELLTVMVKREKGYNAESGDWEYLVFDGSGKKIEAQGKLANCNACHVTVKDTNYVFRSYLPRDVATKLK